jgi:redox-sensitive bicupin YhaK (pirin superfamily)
MNADGKRGAHPARPGHDVRTDEEDDVSGPATVDHVEATPPGLAPGGPELLVLPDRVVPLGGLRGTSVSRTLPDRTLPTVGAWCFLDRFGPDAAAMRVLPHPHTGLATVTWIRSGAVRHRDGLGSDVVVRPGQLNLMTAGRGVAHSELSTSLAPGADRGAPGDDDPLEGVQLWLALPDEALDLPADFQHVAELPVVALGTAGATATVLVGELVGELAGARSPARVHTPLVGAQLELPPGPADVPLDPAFEHALLVLAGSITVADEVLTPGPLLYLGTDRSSLTVTAAGPGPATVLLLGGEPFPSELVMWWNFIGRSTQDIAAARADWEAGSDRFAGVAGHGGERISAPPMPAVRLRPRRRRAVPHAPADD